MSEQARLAVVTGGTGGLGTAICRQLADDGFRVVAGFSPANSRVQAWAETQRAEGRSIDVQEMDVTGYASCQRAFAALRERLGPVAVLVNNAGITRDASFRRMTTEDWQQVLRTNLDSVFNVTKQVIEDMLALGWGRIVNISSVNGQRGAFGQANYAAAKAGMHGFTRTLALEFAKKGITVNTVSPGYLHTRMTDAVPADVMQQKVLPDIPLGRLGEPEEVARVVSYLVSPHAAFVTGSNLEINGGQHMA